MAGSQTSNKNISANENVTGSQTSTQNSQQNTSQQQNQSSVANKQSWLLNMPGLQQIVNRVTQEMNQQTIQPYQLAGFNSTQQAALNTLSQERNTDQIRQLLGQYQNQAAGFTNYGQQQSQINQLAQGYYQGDLVNQNKQDLMNDINRQLAGQVNTLNQQAVGSGNMASSRAGVAQGVMTRGAQEAYTKGALGIENDARNAAYNMAYSQYNQGQSNLFNSLGQQTQMAGNLMNVRQQDAQTAFNAGLQYQKQTQQQLDLNRQNAIMAQSPGLQALQQYLPSLSNLAEFGVSTTGNTNSSMTGNQGISGTTNTSGSQNTSGTQSINFSGNQTGDSTNWADLGAATLSQAAGFALQPAATAAGNWLASLI